MLDRKELKSVAKEQIQGNIGILFICKLIVFFIVVVASSLPTITPFLSVSPVLAGLIGFVGSFATIILVPPFMLSFAMIYLKLREGQSPVVGHIFNGYSIMGKSIWLYILMQIFIFLWSLLLLIPGLIKAYAYMLSFYILAENPGMTAREALRESKRITKGYKWSLFVLGLSFLLWALLGIITFGIALIYVIPYYEATFANAYKKIQAEQAENPEQPFEETTVGTDETPQAIEASDTAE